MIKQIFILLLVKFLYVSCAIIQVNVTTICTNLIPYGLQTGIYLCKWKLGIFNFPDTYETAMNDCPFGSKLLDFNLPNIANYTCNDKVILWKLQTSTDNSIVVATSGAISFLNLTILNKLSHFACSTFTIGSTSFSQQSFDCTLPNLGYTKTKTVYIVQSDNSSTFTQSTTVQVEVSSSVALQNIRTTAIISIKTEQITTYSQLISYLFNSRNTSQSSTLKQNIPSQTQASTTTKQPLRTTAITSQPTTKQTQTKLTKANTESTVSPTTSSLLKYNVTKERDKAKPATTTNNFKIQNTTSATNTTTDSTWYTVKCVIQKSRRNLHMIQTVNFTVDNLKSCDLLDEQYKKNYIATYNTKRDEQLNAIKMKTEMRINKIATQYKTPIYSSYITGIVALIVILGFLLLVLLNDSIKFYFYLHDFIKPALRVNWLVPERVQVFKTFHERERCMSQVRELDKQISNKFEAILLKNFAKK